MDWVIKKGLAEASEVPYVASDGSCQVAAGSQQLDAQPISGSSLLQISERAQMKSLQGGIGDLGNQVGDALGLISATFNSLASSPRGSPGASPAASFGMTSWERLPENKYEPLLEALQDGPVGVSVSASTWFSYSSGIFDKCDRDAVIDHAVLLIGYGQEGNGAKYWLVKNSWGVEWGESGFMRLLRREDEGDHCGIDHQPELGSGCDGGPSEVTVCGTCGILYDTVVPHFTRHANSKTAQERALAAMSP